MKASQTKFKIARPDDPYCLEHIKRLEALGYGCTNYYHEADYGQTGVYTLVVTDRSGSRVYAKSMMISTLLLGKEYEHAKQDAIRTLYRDALCNLFAKVPNVSLRIKNEPKKATAKPVVDNWWR